MTRPIPSGPFSFQDLQLLFEYLRYHSRDIDAPEFSAQICVSNIDRLAYSVLSSLNISYTTQSIRLNVTVYGIPALRQLFEHPSIITVEYVTWKGVYKSEVIVNCYERTVRLFTETISFIEVCRHRLSRSDVRLLTIDMPCSRPYSDDQR